MPGNPQLATVNYYNLYSIIYLVFYINLYKIKGIKCSKFNDQITNGKSLIRISYQ